MSDKYWQVAHIFTMPKSEKILPTLSEVGQQPEIELVASYKPEVLISQILDHIATNFQMHIHYFWGI